MILVLLREGFLIHCRNVPLNDALAIVKPESTEGASLWAKYLINWTFWNHVRTSAAIAAAALITIGLCDRTVK
ncbi:anthrone oxygenase family protein [Phormidesmis priestleyi]